MKKNKKKKDVNVMMILMVICVVLSLTMLAIVAYDKLIREQCKPCSCANNTSDSWVEPWSD